jgi:molybdenum cofactor guanylyltransferase
LTARQGLIDTISTTELQSAESIASAVLAKTVDQELLLASIANSSDHLLGAGAIVLCGGLSRRMGRSKAWLPFGPETMLQRIVRVMGEVVESIIVVAAPNQQLPKLSKSVIIAHDDRPNLGPLSGFAAGLAVLKGRATVAYLSSCDVPFLLPAFVRRVVQRLGSAQICLPEVGGHSHPLAAAYGIDVLPAARALLAEGQLRLLSLADRLPVTILTTDDFADVDPTCSSLRNVNSPDEYEAALFQAGYEQ